MNATQRFNLLGRNTVIRKQDERTASLTKQLMGREKKSKLSLNLKARSHHRCSRLHQRPGEGDESEPNWLVCEAAEAGCVPAVSSRRLTSFSFIILVTAPPRPEHQASSSAAFGQKNGKSEDGGSRSDWHDVPARTDEENLFFLFVFAFLPLTLSPLLANPLTTWQRVSIKKCESVSSSVFLFAIFPLGKLERWM